MLKRKTFTHFGKQYETEQFPAILAIELFENLSPAKVLSKTSCGGINLGSASAINDIVKCESGVAAPYLVLRSLIEIVVDYSIGDINADAVKIPRRFIDDGDRVESVQLSPPIAFVITQGYAKLYELETVYSLPDVRAMIDAATADAVNKAIAHEEAMKASKR